MGRTLLLHGKMIRCTGSLFCHLVIVLDPGSHISVNDSCISKKTTAQESEEAALSLALTFTYRIGVDG